MSTASDQSLFRFQQRVEALGAHSHALRPPAEGDGHRPAPPCSPRLQQRHMSAMAPHVAQAPSPSTPGWWEPGQGRPHAGCAEPTAAVARGSQAPSTIPTHCCAHSSRPPAGLQGSGAIMPEAQQEAQRWWAGPTARPASSPTAPQHNCGSDGTWRPDWGDAALQPLSKHPRCQGPRAGVPPKPGYEERYGDLSARCPKDAAADNKPRQPSGQQAPAHFYCAITQVSYEEAVHHRGRTHRIDPVHVPK